MADNNQILTRSDAKRLLTVVFLLGIAFTTVAVSPAVAAGPYHVGLDFIETAIDPAPTGYWPCIPAFPSSCNGFAPFDLTDPSNNFVTQGAFVGWTEDEARRAVALAVDDAFRDIDTGDPTQRVRISIHLGAVPLGVTGKRLNVVLSQLTIPENNTTLLGSASGSFNSANDEIVSVTYLHNVDALGDGFVTYDTAEKAVNAIAGTTAHEIGHVFGADHVDTLPGETEPYALLSREQDGLPTAARLTERRFSTTKPAGTSNAQMIYQTAGLATIGDINFDTIIDGSDAGVMFGNWGLEDRLYNEGDLNGDRLIDGADMGITFANWTGDPGPAAPGAAIAEYNPATGEIVVSVTDVVNWSVEQVGGSAMTGLDSPLLSLSQGGGLVSDNDFRVGETGFSTLFSYTDVNLGAVAATGLPDDGTLKIFWNPGMGVPAQEALVVFVPEPATLLLAGLSLTGLLAMRRRRVG